MNSGGFLSIRDYLTYYLAGLAWLALVASIFAPITQPTVSDLLYAKSVGDAIGAPLAAALVVVIPYLAGFALNAPGQFTAALLLFGFGDPRWLVVDPKNLKHRTRVRLFRYKTLEDETINLAVAAMNSVMARGLLSAGHRAEPMEAKDLPRMFNLLRTYISNRDLRTGVQAARNQILANLAESLLLPLPAIFIVLAIRFNAQSPAVHSVALGLLIGAVLSVSLLARQYLYSREMWSRHVYWTLGIAGILPPSAGTEGRVGRMTLAARFATWITGRSVVSQKVANRVDLPPESRRKS